MPEPDKLVEARRRLAEAEAGYRSRQGLAHLAEGLALLDDVAESAAEPHATTARNLASTYAGRIYANVKQVLASDPAIPEPELEHFFQVVLVFDQSRCELPPSARTLKIEIVRQLIDRYYEGHSPEAKRRALEQLRQIAGGG